LLVDDGDDGDGVVVRHRIGIHNDSPQNGQVITFWHRIDAFDRYLKWGMGPLPVLVAWDVARAEVTARARRFMRIVRGRLRDQLPKLASTASSR